VSETPTNEPVLVDISHFQQLDLRTGAIRTAERHPSADRLLVLQVDLGEAEPRTIVAGLAPYYPDPSTLVGSTVVVVANLKPVKLRGILSQGMILAAGGSQHAGLLTVSGPCPPGEIVR
jgi:methionyl-tRNA synthetase